jgi:hypothetical protein
MHKIYILYYPGKGSQTKSSSIPVHSVCARLKYFTHPIHSSLLWYSEKRPVQNTQSASFSSTSVESSAKGTARSVFEPYKVSDGVGSRQTLSSVCLEDQEEHWTQADWFWITRAVWFPFSELPQHIFCNEFDIFFAVQPRVFGCVFRLGTELISDARRASAEVNGAK